MLHYHALYLQCSQADTQVLCGKLHNSKDHDVSTKETRARAIAPHFPQFLTRQKIIQSCNRQREEVPRTKHATQSAEDEVPFVKLCSQPVRGTEHNARRSVQLAQSRRVRGAAWS